MVHSIFCFFFFPSYIIEHLLYNIVIQCFQETIFVIIIEEYNVIIIWSCSLRGSSQLVLCEMFPDMNPIYDPISTFATNDCLIHIVFFIILFFYIMATLCSL